MMKKLIAASILLGLLSACGSSPKSSSTASGDEFGGDYSPTTNAGGEGSTEGNAAAGFAQSANAPKPAAGSVSQAGTAVSQSTLVDAIKSQNDEQISRIAGQLLTQNPNDVRALNAMAMYYFKKGKVDAAKFLLNKAIVANPNVGEVHNNMGLIYLSNNERREAIKSFRKALDINGNDGIAAANAGSIYVIERDYVKAATALSVAYNHGVRDAKTMNNYAAALTAVQRFDEAAGVYQSAMKEQNNNRELLLNYAIL
ncbi:MAG: tetratricopeptide repeat protein, partial [Proteobacteria bacterium]